MKLVDTENCVFVQHLAYENSFRKLKKGPKGNCPKSLKEVFSFLCTRFQKLEKHREVVVRYVTRSL